jgi:predicted nucleotidyltransferase
MTTRRASVDDLLAELARVTDEWPDARLGLYLHGSHARGEAREHSDVDVLALAHPSTPAEAIDAFKTTAGTVTHPLADRLDLKAFTTTRFAADPWVKLDRARFIGGWDWRSELPTPTFDEQAREALGVFAVVVEDDKLSDAGLDGVRKNVSWMATIVAGHTAGIAPASGSEARQLLRASTPIMNVAFGPLDGSAVIRPLGSHDLWMGSLRRTGSFGALAGISASKVDLAMSRDGQLLAYVSDESGQSEIHVLSLSELSSRVQVSRGGGTQPVWSPDGRYLFYRSPDRMMRATVNRDGRLTVERVEALFQDIYERHDITNYDVLPGGEELVMIRGRSRAQ